MNRVLLTLAALFLFAVVAQAQPACTMGYDNVGYLESAVAMAVSAAPDGTVICVQAGSATGADAWTSSLDLTDGLTKCVEVRGHGTMPSQGSAGETIIEFNFSNGIAFYGWSMGGSSCTVDNFRFQVNGGDALPFAIVQWSRNGSGKKPWLVHHNDFQVTGRCDAVRMIEVADHHGVIYRNKFTAEIIGGGCDNTNTDINAIAHDITDDGSYWASASTFGALDTTGENLYVETNYFENLNVALDANSSSRIVWRFNTMRNASWVDHGYDSSSTGDRQQETYNNEWICDEAIGLGAYMATRGATHRIFNNSFPPRVADKCGIHGTTAADIGFSGFKLFECDVIGGWPGQYNGGTGSTSYPVSHQVGWGWAGSGTQVVGATTTQNQPGLNGYPTDGFEQILDPSYVFNNTNTSGNLLTYIDDWRPGTCRAMAYSNTGKGGGAATTLTIPNASAAATPYYNVGQEAVVVFSDLVGGTAPTISDGLGNTWSALTGGTNGGMRLSAWHSHITTGGRPTIIVTFDSSTAARAGTLVVMRGMTASPVDQNPAVTTDNTNPYDGPTVGGVGGSALAQSNEIVIGYYALQGPTSYNLSSQLYENDAYTVAAPENFAMSCLVCGERTTGVIGTTGSTDTTNTTVGATYQLVTATSAVNPKLSNGTANRNGITGTVSFKVASNDNHNLDFLTRDFIQYDREIYTQNDSFDGTSGAGSGVRASRPATCTTGVAYWSTDQGSWNSTGADGVLDKCTSTNTWTNAWYVPYDYPNPLATVTGGTPCVQDHLTYISQPTSAALGASIGTPTVGIYDSGDVLCSDDSSTSVVVSKNGSATWGTLAGTLTRTASSGIATFSGLTVTTTAGSGTIDAAASMLTGTTSDSITISSCTPDHLAFIGQPSNAVLGAVLGTVSVGIYDSGDNLCTAETSTIIITNSGGTCTGMTLGGTSTGDAVAGVFTTTNLTESVATGACTIKGSFGALTDGTSSSFTISAAVQGTGGGIGSRIKLNVR